MRVDRPGPPPAGTARIDTEFRHGAEGDDVVAFRLGLGHDGEDCRVTYDDGRCWSPADVSARDAADPARDMTSFCVRDARRIVACWRAWPITKSRGLARLYAGALDVVPFTPDIWEIEALGYDPDYPDVSLLTMVLVGGALRHVRDRGYGGILTMVSPRRVDQIVEFGVRIEPLTPPQLIAMGRGRNGRVRGTYGVLLRANLADQDADLVDYLSDIAVGATSEV